MKKLTPGMHIRVLSPSDSVESIGKFEANLTAKKRLESLGFQVSFSEHYLEHDLLGSASIQSRVADLHTAFADDAVDVILATIGGSNSNELLPYLDYDLIAQHPKIICGYSDTTALLNAIYAKTGLKTYMGTSYSSFKMEDLQDYQTTFPRFAKIKVNGKEADPLYDWLKNQASGPLGKRIEWNFAKFLINRDGQVVKRFSSKTDPLEMEETIKKLLSDKTS